MSSEAAVSERRICVDIFLVSVLALYLEMMIIRWIGTEVRIFSYLQNSLLVVCFLGMGMGCLKAELNPNLRRLLLPLCILCFLIVIPTTSLLLSRISEYLSVMSDLHIWFKGLTSSPEDNILRMMIGIAFTSILMWLIWNMFLPLGQRLAKLLDNSASVFAAYSANIAGSLLGVLLFAFMGTLNLSPRVWGWVLVALILLTFRSALSTHKSLLLPLALIFAAFCFLGTPSGSISTLWSPYQKLELKEFPDSPNAKIVQVNNVGYQLLLDLSQKNIADHRNIFGYESKVSHHDVPFMLHPRPLKVLIIGAGSGNDIAAALRYGVNEIVAVEIDPAIIQIGKSYHPESPYASDRVRVVNDDARAYLARSKEEFDLIVFGLLDAHTSTALTNIRLDHYVYTIESMQLAKKLLAENGTMVLSFGMNVHFIVERMAHSLMQVFDQDPIVFLSGFDNDAYGWGGSMFVSGAIEHASKYLNSSTDGKRRLAAFASIKPPYLTQPATDDWPYIYLQSNRIPVLYFIMAALIVSLFFMCSSAIGISISGFSTKNNSVHFFCMGAAFLLLEVHSVSKAALLLGNTWIVNATILSAIMLMTLFANWLTMMFRLCRSRLMYIGLFAACIGLYFFDIAQVAHFSSFLRHVCVGALLTVPVCFSAMIFMKSFSNSKNRGVALGANLFGALIGGLLQSVSFITGMQNVMLIVIAFYCGAFVFGQTGKRETVSN